MVKSNMMWFDTKDPGKGPAKFLFLTTQRPKILLTLKFSCYVTNVILITHIQETLENFALAV